MANERRKIAVNMIYRSKTEENIKVQSFMLFEGESIVWSEDAPFTVNHIEFITPDWSYNLEEAKRQGVEELKKKLRSSGFEEWCKELAEILTSDEDTYED